MLRGEASGAGGRAAELVRTGSRDGRERRVADKRDEARVGGGVRGGEVVLGRGGGQPRREAGDGVGRRGCRGEEAVQEGLHGLHDEVEVALELETVRDEHGL